MGFFDAFSKKCNCFLCNTQMKESEANVYANFNLCGKCRSFFDSRCISFYYSLTQDELTGLMTELSDSAQRYKDTFIPALHFGQITIDTTHGLFSCGDNYVAGQSPVFRFADFELFEVGFGAPYPLVGANTIEYRKKGKGYLATGCYQAHFISTVRKDYFYLTPELSPCYEVDTAVFTYEKETVTGTEYDNCYYYVTEPEMVLKMAEITHQYLKYADDNVLDEQTEELVKGNYGAFIGQWLFYSGRPYFLSASAYAHFYDMVNSRFDRSSDADELEKLANKRLDEILAWCLTYCTENRELFLKNDRIGYLETYGYDYMKRISEVIGYWWSATALGNGARIEGAIEDILAEGMARG